MVENVDDTIDLDRLSSELEKFNNLMKDGEDSDGGTETCLDSQGPELDGAPSFLTKYLLSVAKSGNPLLPWKAVKTFIRHKIDSILSSFYEKYGIEDIDSQNLPPFNYIPAKEKLLEHFDTFTGAPFTIQRLCEIIIDPGRHYKRTDKLLRGLEKNILVVSTVGRLSDDCSDPQQRSMLFNGLQMTAVRSFRPPLPDNADKFPISSDDSDLKDDEGGPQQHNGDESGLLEDEEPSFEEECLKHDLEDDEMDDMDEELRPRLGCGSALAGALAGSGSSHPALEGYSLSANSVISVRRKRKEEHKQHALHSKRIRMEHAVREQQLQQAQAGVACKEEDEEGEEEVVIGPMPLEAMDTSCEDRLSSPVGKVEGEASSSGSEDEQTTPSSSPSKPCTAARVPTAADEASKSSKEAETKVLNKEEPVSEKDEVTEMDTSVPDETDQPEAPQEAKQVTSSEKSEEAAEPVHQTKQDVKLAKETHKSSPPKAADAIVAAEQEEEEQEVAAPKQAPVEETNSAQEASMEQDPPEAAAVTDGGEVAVAVVAATPPPAGEEAVAGAVDTAILGSEEEEAATAALVEANDGPTSDDDKGKVVDTSTDSSPEEEKQEAAAEEEAVPKDVSAKDEEPVAAPQEKVQGAADSVEDLPAVSEQPAEDSSETRSVAKALIEDDTTTQTKDEK